MKKALCCILTAMLLVMFACSVAPAQETAEPLAEQLWPPNSEIYYNDAYPGQQSDLNVVIENQDVGYASLIKLYDVNGDLVRCLFAGKTEDSAEPLEVLTMIPGGEYRMKIGIGKHWYGLEAAFGEEGVYSELMVDEGVSVFALDAGYVYTLYIDTALDISDAQDVESVDIPYADF
jgi:hypothetical protein